MKAFITYASEDAALARRFADGLRQQGLDVWFDQNEIFPGDNWAAITAQALKESDAMVVLYTPHAEASETVQRNIGFALGNARYRDRLIPVLVGAISREAASWIAQNPQAVRLADPARIEAGVKAVCQTLLAPA